MKTYPYWWEFYKPYHFQNTQVSNSSYDLVVVGAGYTGVNAAIQASSKGLKTLLIDQLALGEGAPSPKANWSMRRVFRPFEEAWIAAFTPVYPAPTTTRSYEEFET